MRRLVTAFLAVASLSLCAQDATPRFAFFSYSRLAAKSVKAAKLAAELEVMGKNYNDRGNAKIEEGKKIQAQLQSGSLSDEGKEALQKQLRSIDQELKNLQDDAQAAMQKAQAKVIGEMKKVAGPIADALAKEQKLAVVFNEGALQMIFTADDNWLFAFTDEVARRLDASNEGGAAAKPAAPAAKPAAKPATPPAKKN
jgi:Skp family chaperone for outer membrane proteins